MIHCLSNVVVIAFVLESVVDRSWMHKREEEGTRGEGSGDELLELGRVAQLGFDQARGVVELREMVQSQLELDSRRVRKEADEPSWRPGLRPARRG